MHPPESSSRAPRRRVALALVLLVLLGGGCRAGGCVAASFGDVVGATSDAYCDRRYVPADREPGSFCQEIVDTLAGGHFQDDCRDKHAASTGEGRCAQERRLGGCKIRKENDDGSEVFDWFYDVTDLEADAGLTFTDPARTTEDVQALCADPARYEEGATFVAP